MDYKLTRQFKGEKRDQLVVSKLKKSECERLLSAVKLEGSNVSRFIREAISDRIEKLTGRVKF